MPYRISPKDEDLILRSLDDHGMVPMIQTDVSPAGLEKGLLVVREVSILARRHYPRVVAVRRKWCDCHGFIAAVELTPFPAPYMDPET